MISHKTNKKSPEYAIQVIESGWSYWITYNILKKIHDKLSPHRRIGQFTPFIKSLHMDSSICCVHNMHDMDYLIRFGPEGVFFPLLWMDNTVYSLLFLELVS